MQAQGTPHAAHAAAARACCKACCCRCCCATCASAMSAVSTPRSPPPFSFSRASPSASAAPIDSGRSRMRVRPSRNHSSEGRVVGHSLVSGVLCGSVQGVHAAEFTSNEVEVPNTKGHQTRKQHELLDNIPQHKNDSRKERCAAPAAISEISHDNMIHKQKMPSMGSCRMGSCRSTYTGYKEAQPTPSRTGCTRWVTRSMVLQHRRPRRGNLQNSLSST